MMKLKEFKAVLKGALLVSVFTDAGEPILITKSMALKIVRSVHGHSESLRKNNFSGRIFVSILQSKVLVGSSVMIGISPEYPGAEEVTP